MKVAVISPSREHLRDMGATLEMEHHTVVLVEGGKSRMRGLAEHEQPDLMLVDGMCCDPNELAQIEHITTHLPHIAVILLCSTHTPEFLINSMRAGVREVLPSPASPEALTAAVQRIATKKAGVPAGRSPGRILAFMPCKGGSGATFIATNLGWQLAESGSVLLMDLNLQFGDALSFVHDGRPATTLSHVARDIGRLDASFLAASAVRIAPNYSVLAAPEDPAHAIEVKPEHVDAILALAVTQYDYVLLDMSRTLDTLCIKALDRAHRVYPVLQAGLPHVRNASKLLEVFRSLGYRSDKVEMIVNRHEKGGDIGLDQIQRTLGAAVKLHTVPNSYRDVNSSINHGEPLTKTARSSAVARIIAEFARALGPKQEEDRGLLGRLFRRA